ncbi:MAG: type IV pilus modification protein PilV [Pseudomonadota bacterium]
MQFVFFKYNQRGTSMLEVLITIAILAVGLLGLAGLQSRLQVSEMESYQRSQALILLNDMASRITTNRTDAANYVTSSLGAGMTCPTALTTQKDRDMNEWCKALQGSAETIGSNNVGAMVGGRGCVEGLGGGQYMVTVAWQGLVPISAPPASVSCGQNNYNSATAGAACVNDLCRRVVTTIVQIATLS